MGDSAFELPVRWITGREVQGYDTESIRLLREPGAVERFATAETELPESGNPLDERALRALGRLRGDDVIRAIHNTEGTGLPPVTPPRKTFGLEAVWEFDVDLALRLNHAGRTHEAESLVSSLENIVRKRRAEALPDHDLESFVEEYREHPAFAKFAAIHAAFNRYPEISNSHPAFPAYRDRLITQLKNALIADDRDSERDVLRETISIARMPREEIERLAVDFETEEP